MSHIKYVKNAIGLIIQDTTFVRRFIYAKCFIMSKYVYICAVYCMRSLNSDMQKNSFIACFASCRIRISNNMYL